MNDNAASVAFFISMCACTSPGLGLGENMLGARWGVLCLYAGFMAAQAKFCVAAFGACVPTAMWLLEQGWLGQGSYWCSLGACNPMHNPTFFFLLAKSAPGWQLGKFP